MNNQVTVNSLNLLEVIKEIKTNPAYLEINPIIKELIVDFNNPDSAVKRTNDLFPNIDISISDNKAFYLVYKDKKNYFRWLRRHQGARTIIYISIYKEFVKHMMEKFDNVNPHVNYFINKVLNNKDHYKINFDSNTQKEFDFNKVSYQNIILDIMRTSLESKEIVNNLFKVI